MPPGDHHDRRQRPELGRIDDRSEYLRRIPRHSTGCVRERHQHKGIHTGGFRCLTAIDHHCRERRARMGAPPDGSSRDLPTDRSDADHERHPRNTVFRQAVTRTGRNLGRRYGGPMGLIDLQGAINVRDLGGFRTADGRRTARGRLLRGDGLHKLTDGDVATLAELGLRTAIDFRSAEEIEHAGPDRLPDGATAIALPIAGGNLGQTLKAIRGETTADEDLGGGRAAELMREINRQFVNDPEYRAAFGRALRLISESSGGASLFHCSAGKDRTGWMTAIVLTALGVPRDEVTADYLATNDYVWPTYEAWLTRSTESGVIADPQPIRELLRQHPSYIDAAFEEASKRYGSFDRFLSEGLEFDDTDRRRLRYVLLE
ncbi:tyrosine-protein phosphatase [Nocardia sp. CA-120079]|uniref:tyrosine-protein phosphatase n=1 Tax=Nocardia sp. CA-120079 TaxID=3239974 RepID=UPI003D96E76F